ncbi:MAG: transcription antitermination factor NusB [Coriobacteriia bacterium]|nr:transcription antitermination factor NusB [Coriobacteriia bacterium]MBS5477659.1 transcription antitermination factor NusB [Coriobacteriia bacterium]
MSSILVGRTRARSQAIQLLFQAEIQAVDVFDLLASGQYVLEDGPLDEYGEQLARGVARTRLSIDRLIAGVSQNWNLSRMPLVDRTIMSVAVHEIFDEDEVPTSVAISEAVEISKVYGTDDSSSFVNGVLGRVARLADEHPDLGLAQIAKLVAPVEEAPAAPETADEAPLEGDAAPEAAQADVPAEKGAHADE